MLYYLKGAALGLKEVVDVGEQVDNDVKAESADQANKVSPEE